MASDTDHKPRGKMRKWEDNRIQHGGRSRGPKKRNLGRKVWNRQDRDRRSEVDDRKTKREQQDDNGKDSALSATFTQEEIDKEERRPKHKVAVLIGYSGTGYKGMQINTGEKTIEGDLFSAFIAASAISKANANDPKKSQLVRCARTDKGVHAAGNVISLKLIVEDEDVVEKINTHLSPQIRVWGIQRTTNSFSAYQACDSRWYEYLIPTHSFLPPHPSSWLARKLKDIADEAGDRNGYDQRQEEVATFWDEIEAEAIKPILDELSEDIKPDIQKALYEVDIDQDTPQYGSVQVMQELVDGNESDGDSQPVGKKPDKKLEQMSVLEEPAVESRLSKSDNEPPGEQGAEKEHHHSEETKVIVDEDAKVNVNDANESSEKGLESERDTSHKGVPASVLRKRQIDQALRSLRRKYQTSKRTYRIHPSRLARIQPILNEFLGTKNFHNYTIQKSFHDPSSKRHIKSFTVDETPIVINGTEWLSIKIHGQSFMMHQIRKMIAMVALTIRCGCDPARITETFQNVRVSIPKAPALGLLLERPVFDSYNDGPADKFKRERIDFGKHESAVGEFKHREIYQRQFQEEEEGNQFHQFFAHTDNLKDAQLLYLSSQGFEAIKKEREKLEEDKDEKRVSNEKAIPTTKREAGGEEPAVEGQDEEK